MIGSEHCHCLFWRAWLKFTVSKLHSLLFLLSHPCPLWLLAYYITKLKVCADKAHPHFILSLPGHTLNSLLLLCSHKLDFMYEVGLERCDPKYRVELCMNESILNLFCSFIVVVFISSFLFSFLFYAVRAHALLTTMSVLNSGDTKKEDLVPTLPEL